MQIVIFQIHRATECFDPIHMLSFFRDIFKCSNQKDFSHHKSIGEFPLTLETICFRNTSCHLHFREKRYQQKEQLLRTLNKCK